MKIKGFYLFALILSSLLVSNSVTARESGTFYAGGQYALVSYAETGYPGFSVSNLVARTGYNFNQYLAVEGRFGFGIGKDTQVVNTISTELKLDTVFGVYAVGYYEVMKNIELYGLLGFSSVNIDAVGNQVLDSSGSDLSYGLGVEVEVAKHFSLDLEYTSYYAKSAIDISAVSFGANYKF